MKVIVISQYNPNLLPCWYNLALALQKAGEDVHFFSSEKLIEPGTRPMPWTQLTGARGLAAKIPVLRSNFHPLMMQFFRLKPDWIVAQNAFAVPALLYRLLTGNRVKVAVCFGDHSGDKRFVQVLKHMAYMLDAYVDVCDVRVGWRKSEWPRLKADTFVIRHAPFTTKDSTQVEAHAGPSRVVLTASNLMLMMDMRRLSTFISRVCTRGISIDWYFPGTDADRAAVRGLSSHPLFTVHQPMEKSRLMETLRGYDAGLFWAPLADCDPSNAVHRSVFLSSASNKVGEYVAAGLAVAHTGNPGLAYLPAEVSIVIDPTDPISAADALADALADRQDIERKRQSAFRYHLDEMNAGYQTVPFVQYVTKSR